ncbi:MAG TPA: hypothetical protein VLL97_09180, partial [Acidobacteriota bacterium]|nr:hypothetical protein [Acidobacteriota bacterium]
LKLSKEANARIADLVTSQNDFLFPDELSRSAWMRLLRKPGIPDHLELLRVGLISKKHPLKVHSKWQTRLKEFRAQPQFTPLLRGEDIKAMGYKPGPVIGKMLWAIEDLQLEGTIKNREEAFQYIRTHFKTAV